MFDYDLVDKIVERIIREFDPQMVVIFGSVANNTAKDGSDLDLFIVMDTELTYYRRAPAILRKLLDIPIPMDILVVTPEEYEANKNNEVSFMFDILSTGKVAYEA
ncbi:MAG: nucleotidyltransferase domain-containing protein [Candidatus Methanoplasma sp.]|jgi:predicted nucleotidyltransferase|nr:nucleotidyltransferase domain-containing protein [Candidatus Methanoplasma sp.]